MATFTVLRIGNKAIRVALMAVALSVTHSAGTNVWTSIGPEGGSVQSLAVDPRNPSTVYAAAPASGIFKTIDGGASWTRLGSAPIPESFDSRSLAIDSAGSVYAAGCPGVFKTTDGGASWSAINLRVDTFHGCLRSLAIDSQNPGTMYAGGPGIFKTTDGGSSWTQVNSSYGVSMLAIDPQNPEVIYALGATATSLDRPAGLLRSTDGGASWSSGAMPRFRNGQPLYIFTLAVDPQISGTLYAGGQGQDQIFKSTDGGATWSDASFGLPPAPPPTAGDDLVGSLAVSPQNPAVVYALISQVGANGASFFLATSTDGANSWTVDAVPIPGTFVDTPQLTPDPEMPGTLYLATRGGVLKTTDGGGHWKFANSGLRAFGVRSVLIESLSGALLVTGDADPQVSDYTSLFESTDGGANWVTAGAGLPLSVGPPVTDPQDSHTLYLWGAHDAHSIGFFQSTDGGGNWTQISTITGTQSFGVAFAIAPQNPDVMYAGFLTDCTGVCDPKISKSADGGYTWTESQFSLAMPGCCYWISAVAIDPQNSDIVYAGTTSLGEGTGSGLWKSEDGGVSWVNLMPGDANFIHVDPRNPGTIYVLQWAALNKSTDGWQTFVDAHAGSCGVLVIDPQDSDTLYCGGQGVVRSTDGGASWTAVGSGLAGSVRSLAIDPRDPTALYAGTSGGLFVINIGRSTSSQTAAQKLSR
jgi:photosystem II stability/assembly factor-like uncharacterized protein